MSDIPDIGVVDLRQLRDDFIDAQARFAVELTSENAAARRAAAQALADALEPPPPPTPPTPQRAYMVYDARGVHQYFAATLSEAVEDHRGASEAVRRERFILHIVTGQWYDIDGNKIPR